MSVLTDNVTCLGNKHFHFFIVGKKEAALVECGITGATVIFSRQWQAMFSQPNIQYLVAMHAHYDHICGIPSLQELFPAAVVAGSPHAQKVMAKPSILKGFFEQDQWTSEVLRHEGYISEPVSIPPVTTIEVDYLLNDGEVLSLDGGVGLEIAAAPGHSPCSIAAYLPSDRVMFLSDAGGFQISDTEIFPIFFQGYELYIETIKRLMGYPARVLAIAHERIWTGSEIETFYRRGLDAAKSAFVEIRRLVEAGTNGAEMQELLFSRYYHGNLRLYSPENIRTCINLLVRRVQECL